MNISDKRFQFWRVLVALAHEDHTVTEEERDFILSKFDYIDFTDAQKEQLKQELDTKQTDAMTLFEQLDMESRAECLHMAHTILVMDDDFHPAEQRMYEHLKDKHMASLNESAIMSDYRDFLAEQDKKENSFEKELEKLRDDNDFLSGWGRFFKRS